MSLCSVCVYCEGRFAHARVRKGTVADAMRRVRAAAVRTGVVLHLNFLLAIAEEKELEPVPELLSTKPRTHGG